MVAKRATLFMDCPNVFYLVVSEYFCIFAT